MLDTRVLTQCRTYSNQVWHIVNGWRPLAQDTVGRQWIRSTDSVGANLVEGDGRGSDRDALRFFLIARASLRESHYWMKLAADRALLHEAQIIDCEANARQIGRQLTALIKYRKEAAGNSQVHESLSSYGNDAAFQFSNFEAHASEFMSFDLTGSPLEPFEPRAHEPNIS